MNKQGLGVWLPHQLEDSIAELCLLSCFDCLEAHSCPSHWRGHVHASKTTLPTTPFCL